MHCNQKVCEMLGLLPVDAVVHHKKFINKMMYISVQGTKLKNNDFIALGEAIPIFMD